MLLTSLNSGADIHGGNLRSVKTISVFVFSFGASFSSLSFISSTLSSDTRVRVLHSHTFITLIALLCIHSIQAHIVCLFLLGFWLLHVVMSIA